MSFFVRVLSWVLLVSLALGCQTDGYTENDKAQSYQEDHSTSVISEVKEEPSEASSRTSHLKSVHEANQNPLRTAPLQSPSIISGGVIEVESRPDQMFKTSIVYSWSFKKVATGDSITVIPISEQLSFLHLRIGAVTKDMGCWEYEPKWTVESELLTLEAGELGMQEDTSFKKLKSDFVVVYPKSEGMKRLTDYKGPLPAGFKTGTVDLALDANGDGAVDVVHLRYCCNEKSLRPDSNQCQACEESFRVNDDGEWESTQFSGPC